MRGRALAFAACSLLLVAGCSRESDKPKDLDLSPGYTRFARPDAEAPAAAARPDEPWAGEVDAARPQPYQIIVTQNVLVDGGPIAPKVNPDDAVLERARVAAGGCFSSLRAGAGQPAARSAHIALTVIPTGTVSTAEVSSSDTTDERVLACLQQQALSTHFSDNGGGPLRTYAIDVSVFAR